MNNTTLSKGLLTKKRKPQVRIKRKTMTTKMVRSLFSYTKFSAEPDYQSATKRI